MPLGINRAWFETLAIWGMASTLAVSTFLPLKPTIVWYNCGLFMITIYLIGARERNTYVYLRTD